MKFSKFIILSSCISLPLMISSCAMTSDVMDMGKGVYMVSGRAAALRGGTTGATKVAYEAAQKFCLQKSPELHAVTLTNNERDVYQSSASWTQAGGNANTMASGQSEIFFKCEK